MGKRQQNEQKFGRWENLPDGGRRYVLEVWGRLGWRARYLKEVNADEETMRFWQEVYDDRGRLVEIHEKYPVDKGHRKV
jgi:YD repeat-containing protein